MPQNKPQKSQAVTHNNRPENKDNLDSRDGEEQLTKGDDITHNEREKHSKSSKEKKN